MGWNPGYPGYPEWNAIEYIEFIYIFYNILHYFTYNPSYTKLQNKAGWKFRPHRHETNTKWPSH